MELDLVHGRRDFGHFKDGLEVLNEIITHADAAGFSCSLHSFHLLPCRLQFGGRFGEPRAVNQKEVNVIEAQLGQGLLDGAWDVGDVVNDLGCYEERRTGEAGLANGGAQFGFSVVQFCAVEVGDS